MLPVASVSMGGLRSREADATAALARRRRMVAAYTAWQAAPEDVICRAISQIAPATTPPARQRGKERLSMNFGELNKIAGAFLGALLLFLLLGFFSRQALQGGGGGHGHETLAFALEIEDDAAADEEEEEVDLVALASNADPKNGETIYRQCSACHKIDREQNAVGPYLVGVVGRDIGAVDSYSYSDALAGKDGAWDLVALSGFLENPSGWAPGTKMGYGGLADPQDRVDVIAYLNEAGGSNIDLTAGQEGEASVSAEAVDGPEASVSDADDLAAAEGASEGDRDELAEGAGGDEPEPAGAVRQPLPTEGQKTSPDALDSDVVEGEGVGQDDIEQAARETEAEDAMEAGRSTTDRMGDASEGADAGTAYEGSGEATDEGEGAVGAGEKPAGDEAASEDDMTVAATDATDATPEETGTPAGDSLYASVSTEDGRKVFNQCRACHVADQEQNRVGPHLVGVVGRAVASVDGYNYSGAMKEYGGDWTPERLSAYLENPRGVVQGTKMAYRGLKEEADRAAVIKWLNEQAPSPIDLN
jgi:cytochrome c2